MDLKRDSVTSTTQIEELRTIYDKDSVENLDRVDTQEKSYDQTKYEEAFNLPNFNNLNKDLKSLTFSGPVFRQNMKDIKEDNYSYFKQTGDIV